MMLCGILLHFVDAHVRERPLGRGLHILPSLGPHLLWLSAVDMLHKQSTEHTVDLLYKQSIEQAW